MKPKNLLITLVIVAIVCAFVFYPNESHAVYTGDYTYSDENNTIILAYNSILNDFIIRLSKSKGSNGYTQFMTKLNDSTLGFYVYYVEQNGASDNGSLMLSNSNYQQNQLAVVFYSLSSPNVRYINL